MNRLVTGAEARGGDAVLATRFDADGTAVVIESTG